MNIYQLSSINKTAVPTVLAFHGFTGSGADFCLLASGCAGQLNWYAIDLHQQSGMAAVIRSVDDFILSTALNRVTVLGYSMGGRIALQYALARPECVAELILIGASPGIENDHERDHRRVADAELAQQVLERGTQHFIDEWHRQPLIASQKQKIDSIIYASMMSRRYSLSPKGIAADLANFGLGVMPNCWPLLETLRCPTLLVTGVEDKKFSAIARRMLALIPQGQHFQIPASGHAAHLENPQAVIDVLTH